MEPYLASNVLPSPNCPDNFLQHIENIKNMKKIMFILSEDFFDDTVPS